MQTNIEKIKAFLIETLQRKASISLFANYFARIEENYAKYNQLHMFSTFICDYLSIYSNGEIFIKDDLYLYFRDFYQYANKMKSDENILKHIYRYSNYYLKLLTLDIPDNYIKSLIIKINKINATYTYPYLLEVFEDYEFAHINKNTFTDILETVVEYTANKEFSHKTPISFTALSQELNKMLAMKNYIPQIEQTQIKEKDLSTKNDLTQKTQ